jgi:rhodanese-related sulfurtransferase
MLIMNRRQFQGAAVSAILSFSSRLPAEDKSPDPWTKAELLEPSQLAVVMNSSGPRPQVFCVAFPVLYRTKHIIHAEFAGPGSKPEGIEALKSAVASVNKDSEIVLYCGCCPMTKCPNIRPAYKALKDAGFTKVRVLNIPNNFHTDWVAKGYPVEEQLGVPVKVSPPK